MSESLKIGSILSLAKRKNYLEPIYQHNECLIPLINNANHLLAIIWSTGTRGASLGEVEARSGIHGQVVSIYLKELAALRMIVKIFHGTQPIWVYKEKLVNEIKEEVNKQYESSSFS